MKQMKFKRLSDSLKDRYQKNVESIKGSELFFVYVYLLHYKYHKVNPNCDRSFLKSHDCLIKKIINFLIYCNCCVKSWRNKKRFAKNKKN